MATFSEDRLAAILAPYLLAPHLAVTSIPEPMFSQLSLYLDLLLKWNARTNLTAIRDPEEIVRRHFGESLFAGVQLRARLPEGASLLDFGSGAGFPGLPIQLLLPGLRVTLAESQGKKAAFLREAVRTLALTTEVWRARVEALPPERSFDAVTLRAVDKMKEAFTQARARVAPAGWLVTLSTEPMPDAESVPMPGQATGFVHLYRQTAQPAPPSLA